jgi:hypothetical protein
MDPERDSESGSRRVKIEKSYEFFKCWMFSFEGLRLLL